MKQKSIIYFFLGFLFLSLTFLSYQGKKQLDFNRGNWWEIYFSDVKNQSFDFKILNHQKPTNFHWAVSRGNEKLAEGSITLQTGEDSTIHPEFPAAQGRIIVSVTEGSEKKELYKIIE